MINKHSLFFQVLYFFLENYFVLVIRTDFFFFFQNETNKLRSFEIFLKEGGIKFVSYYGNANMKLKRYQ